MHNPSVQPFRSERFVVCAGVGGSRRKVFQIMFGRRDGSLYLSFPYYEHTEGLVSVSTLTPGATTLDLAAEGRTTSHLVKYSHHPDGRAHFSQDGKVFTRVRRQSVPLDAIEGHCFTVQVEGLDSFASLPAAQYDVWPSERRTTLNFDFTEAPAAVKVIGRLYSANRLRGGPRVMTEDERGDKCPAFLVAPPLERPRADGIAMLTCHPIPSMGADTGTTLTFIGGFDDVATIHDHSRPTSMLALAYPAEDADDLRNRIGSIDLPPSGTHR